MKRNTTKRAKKGSHGFKVYKNTYVYIGKATLGKQAVSEELVTLIQDMWNNNPSTKKMRKFVKGITIKRHISPTHGGMWTTETKRYEHIQNGDDNIVNPEWHRSVFIHEVEGHAFWDFSRAWRRERLIAFNELANSMPPVNEYCARNEASWRQMNDEYGRVVNRVTPVHESMTRYANEQHSAITEIIRGVPPSRPIIMSDANQQILIASWHELHY